MSREIDILNKISVGERYEGTPHSRSERILKAIANSEEYAYEAVGRYETLLLCLLNWRRGNVNRRLYCFETLAIGIKGEEIC